jgi:hypothetical protein
MISNYIAKINPQDKFAYAVVLVVSLWFFSHIFKADVSFLIALVVGLAVIYYRDDEVSASTNNLNNDLELKLNGLLKEENKPAPRYFHIDPDMITFFDSISDFRIYNRDSFVRVIRTTDNLLKLRRDLEHDYMSIQEREMDSWQNFEMRDPGTSSDSDGASKTKTVKSVKSVKSVSNIKNHSEIFQAAELLANKGLNYFHSFIINLPPDKFYKNKHKEAMDRYHLLVKRNLDVILLHCKQYSTDILIGQDYGKPRAHNKLQGRQGFSANSFDFF